MKATLIQGLKEKDMQAVLNSYNLNNWYFPSLFPFKFTPYLNWKSLAGNLGIPVAADVVSYNSSSIKKMRPVVQRLQGDIPKIEIARVKEETDLNEYSQLLNYANTTSGGQALVDFIYDDVEYVWKGVNARLEWLALKGISLGKVTLDATNNAGVITETYVDFLVPTAQKQGVTTAWTSGNIATAKPITDLKAVVKAAKAKGIILSYMLTNQDTFDKMVACKQVIDACASFYVTAAALESMSPSLEAVNKVFRANGIPEMRIIDQYVTIEKLDGTQTAVQPWEDGVITFVPSLILGNTFHAPLADEMVSGSPALRVKREYMLVKRFSTEDPVTEVTKGIANAFPAWSSSQQSWLVNTQATTWNK